MQEVNPGQTAFGFTTMEARVAAAASHERLVSFVLGLFALLGLILALSGLVAVARFSILRRRFEIGIRMALGATRRQVLALALVQSLRLIALGVLVGVAASLFITQALARLLYGVSTGDPLIFVGLSIALGVAGIAAALVPALEALRCDPVSAIRAE